MALVLLKRSVRTLGTLTHLHGTGLPAPHMVDVSAKAPTLRSAEAEAFVFVPITAWSTLAASEAEVITRAPVETSAGGEGGPPPQHQVLRVLCSASTHGKTGVEMEALTGASLSALTLYDMLKSASKGIEIRHVRLLQKMGGKSGDWSSTRGDALPATHDGSSRKET